MIRKNERQGCSLKRVLMDISENLTRIALAEDGELKELYYESKRDESLVGNIYAGRVANVMPNLQAAFVDFGVGKNGYYYYGNARAVSDAEKNLEETVSGIDFSSVSGVFVLGTELDDSSYPILKNLPVPYIVIDNNMPHFSCNTITMNNE